jgi:gas vesicle protein
MALLYAPKSGEKTRKDIRRFSQKTVNRLDDLQSDIRSHVTGLVDDVNDVVRDGIRNGKKMSTQSYEQLMEALDTAKKVVEEGRGRLQKILA